MSWKPLKLANKISKQAGVYALECCSAPVSSLIAVPLSNGTIEVYDRNQLLKLTAVEQPKDYIISQAAFDKADSNVIWTCNLNGSIHAIDLRTPQHPALTVKAPNTLLCFDIDASRTTLAAGTELLKEDAFILFWDIRNASTIEKKYEECHSDDVTQIKFHPSNRSAMISGSTDGLCCLYDLSQSLEENALYQVPFD